MTGALAGAGRAVTIVTPTPSRLDGDAVPPGVTLRGPGDRPRGGRPRRPRSSTCTASGRGTPGAGRRAARRGARPLPDRRARHGRALGPAAQGAGRRRSTLALVEGKNLRRASCLHALSRPEIGHLRDLAPWTPVCFVPNGVDLAPVRRPARRGRSSRPSTPSWRASSSSCSSAGSTSRRGSTCWPRPSAGSRRDHPELHLLLAGNDDGALAAVPRPDRGSSGCADRVTYVGHVSGERARQVWAAADAFVLPSYSEGFSMAILEALACRLPVPDHHRLPLPRAGRGRRRDRRRADRRRRHRRASATCSSARPPSAPSSAANGRRLVERDYTWDRQAERLAVGLPLAGRRRARPGCVDRSEARHRDSAEATTMTAWPSTTADRTRTADPPATLRAPSA